MSETNQFAIIAGKESAYKSYREANQASSYAMGIIEYAERWGSMMEQAIAEGQSVDEAAANTVYTANTNEITMYMYGAAARILCSFWEHGEALRQWHNQRYGQTGRGIVNPAVLVEAASNSEESEDMVPTMSL